MGASISSWAKWTDEGRMNLGDYYNTHDFWLVIGKPLHDWLVGLGVPAWRSADG